jgi:hypothetical protein
MTWCETMATYTTHPPDTVSATICTTPLANQSSSLVPPLKLKTIVIETRRCLCVLSPSFLSNQVHSDGIDSDPKRHDAARLQTRPKGALQMPYILPLRRSTLCLLCTEVEMHFILSMCRAVVRKQMTELRVGIVLRSADRQYRGEEGKQ